MLTTDVTTYNTVKKIRRRKPVKSCTFCRQRKLKCDRKKPICSSCKSKNLFNCTYPVSDSSPQSCSKHTELNRSTNNINNSDHDPLSTPSVFPDTNELLLKIQFLEGQINEMKNNLIGNQSLNACADHGSNTNISSTISSNSHLIYNTCTLSKNNDEEVFQNFNQHLPNPLNAYYYLQCKASGRRILYGATSMRTNIFKHWCGLGHKFNQLWVKIKFERNKWKISHNASNLTELKFIEQPIDTKFSTLLKRVCQDFPPYNKCIEIIHNFFDSPYKDLCLVNPTLDKYKVINDFYTYVIPDSENLLPNGDKQIKVLLPGSKKNYYKVAVILQIITLRYFYQNCPESIDLFFLYMLGQMSAKVFFIERLQFMLLRYYYLKMYKSDCDSSNVINIVSSIVSTAIRMGLDRDIDIIYKDQEHIVGNLKSLHILWKVVIFLDLECSFQTGRPLLLSDIDLDHFDYNDIICENPHITKLMRMTKMGRRVLMCINSKKGTPKFQSLVEHIIQFMEKELPPISLFMDSQTLEQVSFNDVRLVGFCLGLILCLNSLNSAVNRGICAESRCNAIHISLLAFQVLHAVTDKCFQLDKEKNQEIFTQASPNYTPYFIHAIGFAAGLLRRVSIIFCSILYNRLTVFENNDLLFYNQKKNIWNPNTLRAGNEHISVLDAIDIYNKLGDKWLSPDDPLKKKIMNNSYIFTVTNDIHLTLRKVLLKCMQYRKLTEDSWITQLSDHMISNSKVSLNGSRSKGLQKMMNVNLIRNESIAEKVSPVSTIINSQPIQPNTEENNYHGSQEIYESTDNKINFSEKELKSRNDDIITYPDLVSPNDHESEKTMANNDRDTNQKLLKEKESDILQRISDEFWSNYNTGWEELLNQTDIHELFDNYL